MTPAAIRTGAAEDTIHSCERWEEPCVTTRPGLVWRMRRPALPFRTGRERGGGDPVGRSRRARMSFGLGGIARRLIDLRTEDRRSDGWTE
ncbi:hypothetical protein EDE08_102495 [Bradyrhizobium sp. R2.2-H]|jgi:hypothetical protein|nr:hypothetical protein EDE10_102495 [Bradyrhizobium sp. Y-H1]TCU80025.1 hypothetical protein EDE08_102495 [Bradyrhizobium sp. R2.2-H]